MPVASIKSKITVGFKFAVFWCCCHKFVSEIWHTEAVLQNSNNNNNNNN